MGSDKKKPHTIETAERALDMLGQPADVDAFLSSLGHKGGFEQATVDDMFDLMAHSIVNDCAQCLGPNDAAFFASIPVSFRNIGLVNAVCVHAPSAPTSFYIGINEGLYYALQTLFTALVLEELRADLGASTSDGTETFHQAVDFYLEPQSAPTRHPIFQNADPKIAGEIQAYIASATTLMLQFVTLHEFAHATLGHHRILAKQNLKWATLGKGETVDTALGQDRDAEFEADLFAFRALMARTKTVQSHWSHCSLIYVFFLFFDHIETRIGRAISELHPPPKDRAQRLATYLKEAFPSDAHQAENLIHLQGLIDKWTRTNL